MIRSKGVVTGVLNNKQNVSGTLNIGTKYINYIETDPTVPNHVKTITEEDISKWNSNSDIDLSGYATKDDLNIKVDKVDGKSLINDSEIERLANISNYDDTEIRDLIEAKANSTDIPTKISELINDTNYLTKIPSEYITETELNNKGYLVEHQDISHLATEEFVIEAIGNVKTTDFKTADELPTENISTNTIYLIRKEAAENNIYEEYIYVNNSWEKIGETDVDLSQYYTKEEINNKGYLTSYDETDPVFKSSPSASITNNDITNWNNKSEFDGNYSSLNGTPELFSGSYNDLTDKPSIPTVPNHVKTITEEDISKWNSMRNIYTSTSSPSASDGVDGDIWIVYEG